MLGMYLERFFLVISKTATSIIPILSFLSFLQYTDQNVPVTPDRKLRQGFIDFTAGSLGK